MKQLMMDKRARTSAFTCFYLVACRNLLQYSKLLQEKGVNTLVHLGFYAEAEKCDAFMNGIGAPFLDTHI